MKTITLQTLITARTLMELAEQKSALGDRHQATAGLIVLQDAVELVFLAVLLEKGVDEQQAIEKLSFDEMVSTIGKLGFRVPRSGALRAMNKLRVTAKHYGQLMEPTTVQGHVNDAQQAIDAVLTAAVGKPLREVFLTELVGDTLPRPFLDTAIQALGERRYLDALVETRKAFFVAFEWDYNIYNYREPREPGPRGGLAGLLAGGWKAPYYTRNPEWIQRNVDVPGDFIQIDNDRWRLDAMEWGINTQTLANIRRLTPEVVQLTRAGPWYVRTPAAYEVNSASHENAALCLDLTIDVIRRQKDHIQAARWTREDKPYDTPSAYIGQPLYKRPDVNSLTRHVLGTTDKYQVRSILHGFDPGTTFYEVVCTQEDGKMIEGFVEKLREEPLAGPSEAPVGKDHPAA